MEDKQLLEMLYNNQARMKIDIFKKGKTDRERDGEKCTDVDVDFTYKRGVPSDDPDCNINHFGYNFYFRTKAGVEARKYKTLKRAITEIKKTVAKYGGEVIKIVIDNGGYRREEDKYKEYYKRTK